MFYEYQINRLIAEALGGAEGHTEYREDRPEGASRYIVGGATEPLVIASESLFREPAGSRVKIREWAERQQGEETIGFWLDEGLAYFDAGESFYIREVALSAARKRGELAIWDRKESKEIRVEG